MYITSYKMNGKIYSQFVGPHTLMKKVKGGEFEKNKLMWPDKFANFQKIYLKNRVT